MPPPARLSVSSAVPTLPRSPRPWLRSPRTWVWVLLPSVLLVLVSVSVSSSLPSSTVLPATLLSVASFSPMLFLVSLSSRPSVFSTSWLPLWPSSPKQSLLKPTFAAIPRSLGVYIRGRGDRRRVRGESLWSRCNIARTHNTSEMRCAY